MAELVRVPHDADGLDAVLDDVYGQHLPGPNARYSQDAAGLAVDLHQPGLELSEKAAHTSHANDEAGDQRGADERLGRRDPLAAAVGVQDGVLGEQLLQGLQVAILGGP